MMSDVSPADLPLIRTSLGLTATASTSSPLATLMRWMFTGLSMIIDLPTVTVNFSGAALGPACWVRDDASSEFCADMVNTHRAAVRIVALGRIRNTYLPSPALWNFF